MATEAADLATDRCLEKAGNDPVGTRQLGEDLTFGVLEAVGVVFDVLGPTRRFVARAPVPR